MKNNAPLHWLKVSMEACERADELNKLGFLIEAQRLLNITEYCYHRYELAMEKRKEEIRSQKRKAEMLSQKQDKILYWLGAIVAILFTLAAIYATSKIK
jgi:hypothetical protein